MSVFSPAHGITYILLAIGTFFPGASQVASMAVTSELKQVTPQGVWCILSL